MEVRDQVCCGYALDAEALRRRWVRQLFCLAWVSWAEALGVPGLIPGFTRGPWVTQGYGPGSLEGMLDDSEMVTDL